MNVAFILDRMAEWPLNLGEARSFSCVCVFTNGSSTCRLSFFAFSHFLIDVLVDVAMLLALVLL